MRKKMLVLLLALLLGVTMVAGAVVYRRSFEENSGVTALNAITELQIDRMTCGSCVKNIRTALSTVDGIYQVDVSVTAGSARVTYDPQKIDAAQIATLVSAVGYPAQVRRDVSATDAHKTRKEPKTKSAPAEGCAGSCCG